MIVANLRKRQVAHLIIVGPPGIGKTAIIYEIARRAARDPAHPLHSKEILMLKNQELIAAGGLQRIIQTITLGSMQARLSKVVDFLEQHPNKYVLAVDELQDLIYLDQNGMAALSVLKTPLASGKFSLIGTTTDQKVITRIFEEQAMERRLTLFPMKPPSLQETIEILKQIQTEVERHYGALIDEEALTAVTVLSDHFQKGCLPAKAINTLDLISAKAKPSDTIYHVCVEAVLQHFSQTQRQNISDLKRFYQEASIQLQDSNRLYRKYFRTLKTNRASFSGYAEPLNCAAELFCSERQVGALLIGPSKTIRNAFAADLAAMLKPQGKAIISCNFHKLLELSMGSEDTCNMEQKIHDLLEEASQSSFPVILYFTEASSLLEKLQNPHLTPALPVNKNTAEELSSALSRLLQNRSEEEEMAPAMVSEAKGSFDHPLIAPLLDAVKNKKINFLLQCEAGIETALLDKHGFLAKRVLLQLPAFPFKKSLGFFRHYIANLAADFNIEEGFESIMLYFSDYFFPHENNIDLAAFICRQILKKKLRLHNRELTHDDAVEYFKIYTAAQHPTVIWDQLFKLASSFDAPVQLHQDFIRQEPGSHRLQTMLQAKLKNYTKTNRLLFLTTNDNAMQNRLRTGLVNEGLLIATHRKACVLTESLELLDHLAEGQQKQLVNEAFEQIFGQISEPPYLVITEDQLPLNRIVLKKIEALHDSALIFPLFIIDKGNYEKTCKQISAEKKHKTSKMRIIEVAVGINDPAAELQGDVFPFNRPYAEFNLTEEECLFMMEQNRLRPISQASASFSWFFGKKSTVLMFQKPV